MSKDNVTYYDFTRPITEEELDNPNCRIYDLYLEDEQTQEAEEV